MVVYLLHPHVLIWTCTFPWLTLPQFPHYTVVDDCTTFILRSRYTFLPTLRTRAATLFTVPHTPFCGHTRYGSPPFSCAHLITPPVCCCFAPHHLHAVTLRLHLTCYWIVPLLSRVVCLFDCRSVDRGLSRLRAHLLVHYTHTHAPHSSLHLHVPYTRLIHLRLFLFFTILHGRWITCWLRFAVVWFDARLPLVGLRLGCSSVCTVGCSSWFCDRLCYVTAVVDHIYARHGSFSPFWLRSLHLVRTFGIRLHVWLLTVYVVVWLFTYARFTFGCGSYRTCLRAIYTQFAFCGCVFIALPPALLRLRFGSATHTFTPVHTTTWFVIYLLVDYHTLPFMVRFPTLFTHTPHTHSHTVPIPFDRCYHSPCCLRSPLLTRLLYHTHRLFSFTLPYTVYIVTFIFVWIHISLRFTFGLRSHIRFISYIYLGSVWLRLLFLLHVVRYFVRCSSVRLRTHTVTHGLPTSFGCCYGYSTYDLCCRTRIGSALLRLLHTRLVRYPHTRYCQFVYTFRLGYLHITPVAFGCYIWLRRCRSCHFERVTFAVHVVPCLRILLPRGSPHYVRWFWVIADRSLRSRLVPHSLPVVVGSPVYGCTVCRLMDIAHGATRYGLYRMRLHALYTFRFPYSPRLLL